MNVHLLVIPERAEQWQTSAMEWRQGEVKRCISVRMRNLLTCVTRSEHPLVNALVQCVFDLPVPVDVRESVGKDLEPRVGTLPRAVEYLHPAMDDLMTFIASHHCAGMGSGAPMQRNAQIGSTHISVVIVFPK